MRRLHLIVSAPAAGGLEPVGRLPTLETLRARGRPQVAAAHLTEAICRAFGLTSSWPVAPYALALDGVDPGERVWLRADPVSLQLFRDHLVLADTPTLGLQQDEAQALIEGLNRHFAPDGLHFVAPVPERWYLALDAQPDLAAQPSEAVAGRDIHPFLPQGADAAFWLARINEAQMLLHEHPVNEAREARGDLPVNSLWPWGAGSHAALPMPACDCLCASHPTALALAKACGLPVRAAAGWADLAGQAGQALVVLDASGDADQDWPKRLEADWLRPALRSLQTGRLHALRLEWPGAQAGCLELAPGDAWKFWRRQKEART